MKRKNAKYLRPSWASAFADSPAFLSVSQIIAAYTFDATAGSTFSAGDTTQNFAAATGSVSYSNHPTFTFTPTTGQAFATAYIRPLAPGLVLPLAESAIPIDLLLRITAQSIGGLQNANAMGGPNANGSVGFFELIQAFRRLQLAGQLNVETRDEDHVSRVYITLGATTSGENEETSKDLMLVRRLLKLSPKTKTYEVVYGQSALRGERIPMVTRSVLGILTDLGAQVDVPQELVEHGSTKPTIGLIGVETRPTIVVHVGKKPPGGCLHRYPVRAIAILDRPGGFRFEVRVHRGADADGSRGIQSGRQDADRDDPGELASL